ncbi:putative angio-associated migratory cell protein [Coemansia reversa NRRL 1564]|uniref:Putative angio-associated migratory cell protein n=1 Tax=Coemansia reversa (strain ATCC 12441 / NRRL 1564) TaxID=763665 RepID=A0A2G5B9S2_COERN|nr:putative angio-associated migratory cell protein [Coemansia reversa NRRL 1564]|eukprot:PIA15769.1 putative angio-associated migratory cell protein [Coemansia reversa NRRL 1564]
MSGSDRIHKDDAPAEREYEEDAEAYVNDDDIADVVADTGGPADEDMMDEDDDEAGTSAEGVKEEVLLEDDSVQGFFAHKEPVFAVDLHPKQQNLVVSGGGDDKAYIWRTDNGEQLAELEKHDDSVSAVKFSNTGDFVATGGMDGKVNVYNVNTREKCVALEGPDEIQWLCWHPRGNVLLSGANDASMWMWSLPGGDFMNVFNGHSAPVTCGQFTPSGRNIVSGAEDGTLIIWDPKSAAVLRQFTPADERFHQEGITCLTVSKDDQIILTGSMDSTAKLVHANGSILGSLENATESVETVGLCESLPLAATGSIDGSLSIWDINTLRLRTTLKHDDSVTKLAWHENSPLVTSVSMDCTIRTWDSRNGDCVRVWKGHQEGIMDLSLSKDGKTIVTASDDGCCLVFS